MELKNEIRKLETPFLLKILRIRSDQVILVDPAHKIKLRNEMKNWKARFAESPDFINSGRPRHVYNSEFGSALSHSNENKKDLVFCW